MMFHVAFDPDQLTGPQKAWWDSWQSKAATARQKAISDWELSRDKSRIRFDDSIWGDLKRWLLDNVFHGKCAYCETFTEAGQWGDAEHYRPKGRVDYCDPPGTELRRAQTEDENGQPMDHPGYFWLAYHWENLFPACQKCNSGEGKQNQFPAAQHHAFARRNAPNQPGSVAAGLTLYYPEPTELDSVEQPLLLNPYKDEPDLHLCFGECGIVSARKDQADHDSARGDHSIAVYRLRRDGLLRERARAQRSALRIFLCAYQNCLDEDLKTHEESLGTAWKAIDSYVKGREPYSQAAVDFVKLRTKRLFAG